MSGAMSTEPTATPSPVSPLSPLRIAIDLTFGAVIPLGCLVFDPIVFRGSDALFSEYALVGYSAAGMGLLALPLWLLFGRPAGLFAGLLAGGAVFAMCLGLVLLPFSVIGLVILIGVLGFMPFVTAWVFARNARRAWVVSRGWRRPMAPVLACVGFVFVCIGPWTGYWYVRNEVNNNINALASDDPVEAERAVSRLKWVEFLVPSPQYDRLVWSYHREADAGRRLALAKAYYRLTGKDIGDRLSILLD